MMKAMFQEDRLANLAPVPNRTTKNAQTSEHPRSPESPSLAV
jgi:hypothetical protein